MHPGMIKRYPEHHGVTDLLHKLRPGDEVILFQAAWLAAAIKN